MKRFIFWDVPPYGPVKGYRCFGRPCRLELQGRRARQTRTHREAGSKQSSAPLGKVRVMLGRNGPRNNFSKNGDVHFRLKILS
jgi:hypothetical protein